VHVNRKTKCLKKYTKYINEKHPEITYNIYKHQQKPTKQQKHDIHHHQQRHIIFLTMNCEHIFFTIWKKVDQYNIQGKTSFLEYQKNWIIKVDFQ